MGAIADAFVAYAQPLLDQTNGSQEELNRAFAITQICYNLALMPEDSRDSLVRDMQSQLEMDDVEFADFQRSIIVPMIRRHQEMFPWMHRQGSTDGRQIGPSSGSPPRWASSTSAAIAEAYPETDRYAPCPCNSGKKYKFCCGKKRR